MVKVTLIRSLNGQVATVKATAAALGLKKIRQQKTFEETPANMGQINKIAHLLKVEKV